MSTILAFILKIFEPLIEPLVANIVTRLTGSFGAIITELPGDEQQILHDAMLAFSNDIRAGKGFGQAAADALDTFYNEEKGEVGKVGKQLFSTFLTATGG